ncbi:nucleotide exchange factor GrpE [Candidatus Gottesmanbacteria bacterium]|nr:nucleotide exchange factor GrpE [Candidatus Gottesmanbacteria bacterium]
MKKPLDDWKNKYLRALADYQNLEKRKSEEIGEVRKFAAEIIISKLLPIVDTFERAQTHLNDPGLELALKELTAVLGDLGAKKLEVIGKEFNPHEMECIEVTAGKDNIIIEETLPGYTLHEKVIRVAQVKVGKEQK